MQNHPNATIIAAAFTAESTVQEVTVFTGGRQIERREGSPAYELLGAERSNAESIHLYDGPPTFDPPAPSKMVCFTSPNETWLAHVRKTQTARTLYIPLWDVEELWAAATCLGLDRTFPPVTRTVIADRFGIFGGVARDCLATGAFASARIEELEELIKSIDTLPELRRLVYWQAGGAAHHRLCHYVPDSDEPWRYSVRIASKFVSLRVLETISSAEIEQRESMLALLRGIPGAVAYRGRWFELKAHALLARGGLIETQSLPGDRKSSRPKVFSCIKSEEFCFFDPKKLSRSTLEGGPYRIPRSSDYGSIDSFYYPYIEERKWLFKTEQILLFQMAVASRHPVNGNEIADVLQNLGLMGNAMADPDSVVLIFVVSKSDNHEIAAKQNILWDTNANSKPVDVIPNIEKVKMDKLKDNNVNTVGDLRQFLRGKSSRRDAFKLGEMKKYSSDLKNFDNLQELKGKMLRSIRQYVWTV